MEQFKVLISGAAGGLGSEFALKLAAAGANLLLLDKSSRALDELSDRICAGGFEEPGVCTLDLSSTEKTPFENLAAVLDSEYGGLDVFIHCAAAFEGLQPLEQISPENWSSSMQVNVNSAWQIICNCLPMLKASGKGRVILIHESKKVTRSAYWGSYGVSKAALSGLGNILEEELQGTSAKVIHIFPGPMRTALRAKAYLAEDPNQVPHPADVAENIFQQLLSSYAD